MSFTPPSADQIRQSFPQITEAHFLKQGGFKAVYRVAIGGQTEAFKLVNIPRLPQPDLAEQFRAESLVIAQEVKKHAQARGLTPGQFATAWVLANRNVTSVIPGPRTLEQWQDYFGAVDYKWTAEDEALIDAHVAPGHPSTPGYTDPSYPFFGRAIS